MCLLGGCTIAGLALKNLKTKARSKRAHQCFNGPAPQIFRWEEPPPRLLTQTEFVDDGLIAFGIVCFEVVEQAATLADQHEKAAARAMVFLVRFKVFRQLTDPLA